MTRHCDRLQEDAEPSSDGVAAQWPAEEATAVAPALAEPVLPQRCLEEVLEIVVANTEERLKLSTHQGSQAFAAACAAAAAQEARRHTDPPPRRGSAAGTGGRGPEAGLESLEGAVDRLVALPEKAKGRYSLLVLLVPYVGAGVILRRRPSLVREALCALREETCTVATHFLKELLLQLRQEMATGDTGGAAVDAWRAHWVGPLVAALRVEDALFRGRVVNYALPMLLDLDPECLPVLLRLQQGAAGGGYSAASVGPTIAVLLAAHSLNLFSSLDAVVEDDAGRCHVPRWLLHAAAVHRDEQLRQQTLELVALHAKTSVVRRRSHTRVLAGRPPAAPHLSMRCPGKRVCLARVLRAAG